MTTPAILADRVVVQLPGSRATGPIVLVDHVSFTVAAGEWLCIVGPNGAGKSTLLRAMAGLQSYRGSLQQAGREVRATSPRLLARAVASMAQQPTVPAATTVADYVLLGRTAHLGWLQREGVRDRQIVAESLDQLDLTTFADRHLETLSGGERQRVILARALAQQPAVLLLDEPTAALDLGHQVEVLELVDRLRRERGLTVVSTMHDLTLAGEFADRLMILHHGKLVSEGTPSEVFEPSLLHRVYGAEVSVLPPQPGSGRQGPVIVPVRSRDLVRQQEARQQEPRQQALR